eukprot:353248-Chlamydomonas_euryale.AAC.3
MHARTRASVAGPTNGLPLFTPASRVGNPWFKLNHQQPKRPVGKREVNRGFPPRCSSAFARVNP